MASFLKVPLTWYRSATFAFFPDETNAMIHRVYTSPREQHTMRHFCGFCGTPLSYWSEEPRSEAEFIQLTLGSLHNEDLGDLEDLGLVPDSEGSSRAASPPPSADVAASVASLEQSELGRQVATRGHREVFGGIPWFDSLVEGSRLGRRLGNVRASKGGGQSRDGTVRYEWEVVEYTEGEDDDGNVTSRSGKRKLDDRDSGEVSSAIRHH